MRYRIFLLINPWIADVAAYNFWMRPLGLYALAEWLWERGAYPILLDCLSPFSAPGKFLRREVSMPSALQKSGIRRKFCRYGISREEFSYRTRELIGKYVTFDAVLVTSAISYWYPGVQWVCEEIRRLMPGTPVLLGGVYPTLWPDHAERESGADFIFHGPLPQFSKNLAALLGLPEKPVRSFRQWYKLQLHDGMPYSSIRTARGCPFSCTYCASRIVSGGYQPRNYAEILDEIHYLRGFGVREFAFYDDALLVDFHNRLRPVLEAMLKAGRVTFHTPNAMHARFIDPFVASLLFNTGFSTVRISLETVNSDRQKESGGKVKNYHVEQAVRYLAQAGYRSGQIGVYLLAALPGQEIYEVKEGIEKVKSMGARPYLSELSPIPGTSVWNELEEAGKVTKDMDPLLTNNSIFYELSGFCTFEQFQELKMMCHES